MTALLQQAVAAAATLPPAEQDEVAARWLDELATDDAFDRKLAATGGRLAGLAAAALAEHTGKSAKSRCGCGGALLPGGRSA